MRIQYNKAALISCALAGFLAGTPAAALADTPASASGHDLFAVRCAMCHSVERNKPSPVGPPLCGVIGRRAGSWKGFPYSPALKALGQPWTAQTLDQFLRNPASMVPGTRMAFGGLGDSGQRTALIEYLAACKVAP